MKKWIVSLMVLAMANAFAFGGAAVTDGADDYLTQNLPNTIGYIEAHDAFGIYDRSIDNLPYDILDDSISVYPADYQGIVDELDMAPFFAVCDTVNGIGSDTEVATWTFDITGLTNLGISIDMAAMGDFEAEDILSFTAKIDNGPEQVIFQNTVNEAGEYTYTMAGGSSYPYPDPMLMNGVLLNNNFQTLVEPVSGSGSVLTLTFSGIMNGSAEAFAFRNVLVDSFEFPDPNTYETYAYDWEGNDFADVITTTGNVFSTAVETDPNGYSKALKITEYPIYGTPTAGVAMVTGLQNGDKITASFKAYDVTPGTYPTVQIGGTWVNSDDLTSNYGDAGNGADYSGDDPNSWSTLTQTWTFSDSIEGANALIINALVISSEGDPNNIHWIDDVSVTVPDHCTVLFPDDLYKAEDYETGSFSWETFPDTELQTNVFLGTFGMLDASLETFDSQDGDNRCARITTKSYEQHTLSTLKQAMERGYTVGLDTSLTPEGFIAAVTGLSTNDYVKLSVFGKTGDDQSEDSGVTIWAHYIYDENDLNSFAGNAYGIYDSSVAGQWTQFSKRWMFSAAPYEGVYGPVTPVGIVFEAEVYGVENEENPEGGYIDNITIEAPKTANVIFPDPSKPAMIVGGLPEGDINMDGRVDLVDFAVFAQDMWLTCNLQPVSACN